MKFLGYIFIILFAKVSLGQNETMPEYPGGVGEMMKFVAKNTKYPKTASDSSWKGKVIVKFTVDTIGRIIETSITKSSGYAILDNEALRVISMLPAWKPGKQKGKNAAVWYTIPINFSL
jgi:protein TonB